MTRLPFSRRSCFRERTQSPLALRVRQAAVHLLRHHGLGDWSFAFNRRKQTMGLCRYGAKTIELSICFVECNSPEEILDTLLHEIAHALVGPKHAHDRVWQNTCLEIGARPERCGQAFMPAGRWQAECGACGRRFDRYRKPKRPRGWFCGRCGRERGKLVWRRDD
jgi:predicted SprT family Zn-dependent metalloprotease